MLIFHGENYPLSRQAYLGSREGFQVQGLETISIDGGNLILGELQNQLQTSSLFGGGKVICIENLFSRRPSSEKNNLISFLSRHIPPPDIVIYDPKDISSQIKSFPAPIIKKFDWPKYLFQFLDSFSFPALRQTLMHLPPEVILASLAKQLHNLLLLKHDSLNLPSWQTNKLQSLSSRFSLPQLTSMERQLLDIDYQAKNSLLISDLTSALEDWCIKNVLLV